jgi:hypothetical protein
MLMRTGLFVTSLFGLSFALQPVSVFGQEVQQVKPTESPYRYDELRAFKERLTQPKVAPPPVQYVDYILYNWIKCDAKWNERCNGAYDFNAPAGWQVCKILFSIASAAGEWGYNYTAKNFDQTPAPKPPKFYSYHFTLYSKGSGNIFDQKGGWVQFNNVGLRIIPQSADNNDRVAMGCEMG